MAWSRVQGVDIAGVLGQHVVSADLTCGGALGADLERAGQDAEPLDSFGPGHHRVRPVHGLLDDGAQIRVVAQLTDGHAGRLALPLLPPGEGFLIRGDQRGGYGRRSPATTPSAISQCSRSLSSRTNGTTCWPPAVMRISFFLPVTYTHPSSSTCPRSPVRSHRPSIAHDPLQAGRCHQADPVSGLDPAGDQVGGHRADPFRDLSRGHRPPPAVALHCEHGTAGVPVGPAEHVVTSVRTHGSPPVPDNNAAPAAGRPGTADSAIWDLSHREFLPGPRPKRRSPTAWPAWPKGPGVHSFLRAVNVQTGSVDADEGRAAAAAEHGRGDVTAAGGVAGPEETEETLREGRGVTVRPLRGGDTAGVAAMWRRLDAPARRRFTDLAHLPSERAGEVALPRPGHAAGIIAIAPAGSVAGVARYERMAGDAAGFLVFVDASWRRAGLGTVLLRRLAEAARHAGVRRMAGDLPEGDVAMRGLLAELGLEYTEQVTAATVHASFAVQETDAYLDAVLADQRAAARVAVGPFLRPGSIALVGASDKPGSVGRLLLAHLLESGFTGPVYPVTARHQVIRGMTCYPELASCPTRPDLALVAVPAPAVAGVVDQAGALGVRAVCVISAGFAEIGGQGRVLQEDR